MNRLTKYTDARGNVLQYAYDTVGNLVGLTYPDGKLVSYEYDAAGQLVKVTDWADRVTVYSYDENGRLISTLRPNGTLLTRSYDDAGQLVRLDDVVSYDFRYDAAGNIIEERSSQEADPDINLEMTYQKANRLATVDSEAVEFDADGNMLSGGLNQFDSRNRLVQAGDVVYAYDAENQRVGVNQTQFVVNSQPALSQVLVKNENGQKTFYIYGLGLIGQEIDGEYTSYHFDFRGSTVALTDSSGQVTESFQYSPYGLLLSGNSSKTPFLFNGMYGVMSDDNGLYYMRARFYSPEIKRFINQDILLGGIDEGQTLNRYVFVTGRPISFVDPFGLSGQDIFDGALNGFFCAVIGGGVAALVITTAPISAPMMVGIALGASASGGFFVGVNGYEVYSGEDYWNGEKLTSSEIDNRKGHVIIDAFAFWAGNKWFRIPSRDTKAVSDWEWLNYSPSKRKAYSNGLGTVSDDLYAKIAHLPPHERNINIYDTRIKSFNHFWETIKTGPGPDGRYAWPYGIAGLEACDSCTAW